MALYAGECYSGSLAGDIYFNAPGITNTFCTYNWSTLLSTTTIPNDICVAPAHAMVQAVKMAEIVNDPQGLQFRTITTALGQYEQQIVFWNSRTLPDGIQAIHLAGDGSSAQTDQDSAARHGHGEPHGLHTDQHRAGGAGGGG